MIVPLNGSQTIGIGQFNTDGVPLSGGTVTSFVMQLNGSAVSPAHTAPTTTDANGFLSYLVSASDTATVGDLIIAATVNGQVCERGIQIGAVDATTGPGDVPDALLAVHFPATIVVTGNGAPPRLCFAGDLHNGYPSYYDASGQFALRYNQGFNCYQYNLVGLGFLSINAPIGTAVTPLGGYTGGWTALPSDIGVNGSGIVLATPSDVTVNVSPGFVGPPSMGSVTTGNLEAHQNSLYEVTFPVIDSAGNPIDLSAVSGLRMVFEDPNSVTVAFAATIGGSHATLTVGGTDNNMVTLSIDATLTADVGNMKWLLGDEATKRIYATGRLTIKPFPVW